MAKRQRRPRRAATIAAVLAVASLTLASCDPVETRFIVGAVTRGALVRAIGMTARWAMTRGLETRETRRQAPDIPLPTQPAFPK